VLVHAGSRADSAKAFPAQQWRAVFEAFARESDLALVVVCAPGEEANARDAARSTHHTVLLDDPAPELSEVIALTALSHLSSLWQLYLFFGVITALGVGTLLSAHTVAYRDYNHLTPFMVQIWMYITPVIFPLSLVPERWQWLMFLNPMTGLVEGFRSAFLDRPFDLTGLGISFVIAIAIFLAGVAYFEKVERRFADII